MVVGGTRICTIQEAVPPRHNAGGLPVLWPFARYPIPVSTSVILSQQLVVLVPKLVEEE